MIVCRVMNPTESSSSDDVTTTSQELRPIEAKTNRTILSSLEVSGDRVRVVGPITRAASDNLK